jgi:hypothetical protein
VIKRIVEQAGTYVADQLKRQQILGVSRLPHVPKRPPELEHLTDEAASAALACHYGNFTLAARELGVDVKLLRRLFWHNPRIMDGSKERTELFHSMVIGELVSQLNSVSYGKYLRAAAELVDYPTIRPVAGLGKELTKGIKKGKLRGRHVRKPPSAPMVNVDAVVEAEVDRKMEQARERRWEQESAAERAAVVIDRRPEAPAAVVAAPARPWPVSRIRRPSRGGWRW